MGVAAAPPSTLPDMYKERWSGQPRQTQVPTNLIPVGQEVNDDADMGCIILEHPVVNQEICGNLSFDSTDDGMVRRCATSPLPPVAA